MNRFFSYKHMRILILHLSNSQFHPDSVYDHTCANYIATWIIQFLKYQFVIDVLSLLGFHL